MAYRHFTVAVKGDNAEEDQLNQFITSHRIVHITKELVSSLSPPAWCYNVEYDGTMNPVRQEGAVDYKKELNPADFELYLKLREVRKTLAEREGKPAYTLFTNRQLAEIARRRPGSLSDLGKVEGVGEGRCKSYGEPVLATVKQYESDRTDRGVDQSA